ncbi:MAG: hypothetical protein NXH88_10015 [Hyphomonas sp.]|nr:hypothetical protein [Hyphomonas sp.]
MSEDYSGLTPAGLAHELGNLLEKLDRLKAEAEKIPEVEADIQRIRDLLQDKLAQPPQDNTESDETVVGPGEAVCTWTSVETAVEPNGSTEQPD